ALAVIAGAVFLLYKYNRTFQDKVSGLAMKIPALGRLSMVSNTSAFSRITTALLQSGVDVVESVRIGASVIKNKHMRHSLEKSLEQVALGASLHSAFQKINIFEPLFVSMVQIGEEASMLPDTFQKMADMYEAESNEASRKFTSVLEPILTMSIGLVIALMVVAIIMPMFNMYSVILG
ncbi:MAG: type II secretion system F family protein, partial [Clostridia bacterium]|nr:type II secretion system F family protein [Clostridia bacterium]